MNKTELIRASELLRNYAKACDEELYKHGNVAREQLDAEDLAKKLAALVERWLTL